VSTVRLRIKRGFAYPERQPRSTAGSRCHSDSADIGVQALQDQPSCDRLCRNVAFHATCSVGPVIRFASDIDCGAGRTEKVRSALTRKVFGCKVAGQCPLAETRARRCSQATTVPKIFEAGFPALQHHVLFNQAKFCVARTIRGCALRVQSNIRRRKAKQPLPPTCC